MSEIEEVEYVAECPSCGVSFVGMTPKEYRRTHAKEACPKAPLPQLFAFPTEQAREQLRI